LLKDNNVPAVGLGIIENGKLTKVEVYGTLDKQKTAPYNTIFKVASLTKPIVALTALKLIDKGLLSLDEPLYKFWVDPDIKNDKRYKKLTPKIILTHQTGFPNWRYMTETNKLAFEFDPGTKYQYSGEGFEYLRKAIENKLGKSIEELATEFLFEPLGMTDTHFWWDSTMDESRYAQNFNEKGEKIETVKYFEANAAANLLTTVEDYGKFLAYVINGAGLSVNLYQEIMKHQVELKENDFFGLGWEILTEFSDNEFALLHTGKDPGVGTLAIWFPKSKNGYLVFLNGDNVDKIYEELLTKRLYLGNDLWNKR
ncbi:MAG: serine hydrolase domain-containing protein, partial [Candidatus Paceibacterota bacterium]